MRFDEYVAQMPRGILRKIQLYAGCAPETLTRLKRGGKLNRIDVARRIVAVTDGVVGLADLIDFELTDEDRAHMAVAQGETNGLGET